MMLAQTRRAISQNKPSLSKIVSVKCANVNNVSCLQCSIEVIVRKERGVWILVQRKTHMSKMKDNQ